MSESGEFLKESAVFLSSGGAIFFYRRGFVGDSRGFRGDSRGFWQHPAATCCQRMRRDTVAAMLAADAVGDATGCDGWQCPAVSGMG